MKREIKIFMALLLCAMFPLAGQAGCRIVHEVMPCKLLPGIAEREYTVCLPDGYDRSTDSYPILYLLHGGGCSNTDWTVYGRLQTVVDSLVAACRMQKTIIVCPEANKDKMIWFDEPEWPFEDYMFNELIPYIENRYRVAREAGKRSVAGFSMGGGGAVGYGLCHPEMFNVVYAMSAYLRRQPLEFLKNDPLGEWRQHNVERHNPIRMVDGGDGKDVERWRSVKWYVDCGDQDFTLEDNMDFVKALRARHIGCETRVKAGGHNWDYWRPSLVNALIYISEQTARRFPNPMLWADVPDPDVIRVGEWFYMVSTTMHLMPGAPVMRSRDLVDWETVSYVFDRLTDSPKYDMQGGTVYGRGQWATSLKYHKGCFYALFAPNDNPGDDTYIYTTEDPTGRWTLVSRLRHFHDASLFFDDDDRVYVVYGTGQMCELTPDLCLMKPGSDCTLFRREPDETGLLEGSRMVKHDGKYYLLMVSWPLGRPRRQVCYRADSINGPYEKRTILETEFGGFSYVGQGTIVDAPDGRWYGVIFQDRGGVGRVLTLMPCRWEDGWPILGDRFGHIPTLMDRPVMGGGKHGIVQSDDFEGPHLKRVWQWNHNPVDEAWSLTERKGWLRLKTSRPAGNLFEAPNTLSQRMEGPLCSATVALDITHLKDGDRAGLAAFNGDSGVLTLLRSGKKTVLVMSEASVSLSDREKAVTDVQEKEVERVPVRRNKVYLRIDADFRPGRDMAMFYYSLDNRTWHRIGRDYQMRFDYRRFFMGTRLALFCYATRQTGGYVDIDAFDYKRN